MRPLGFALCHVALWFFAACLQSLAQAEYRFTADQGHSVLEADPSKPGFVWRIHQIPQIPGFYRYLNFETAEGQLEGSLGVNIADPSNVGSASGPGRVPSDPKLPIEFHIPNIISLLPWAGYSVEGGLYGDGNFLFHDPMPGLRREAGFVVAEALFWIELPKGTTSLGICSHEGVRWTMGGTAPADILATRVLNPATPFISYDESASGTDPNRTFQVTVPATGLYPVRVLMPSSESLLIELYSLNQQGKIVLLNDATNSGLRTFQALLGPAPSAVVKTLPEQRADPVVPDPEIQVTLQGAGIREDASLILRLDGTPVPYSLSHGADSLTVRCTQPVHFASRSHHVAEILYDDGQPRSAAWEWTTRFYQTLTPDMAVSPDPAKPGFHLRLMYNPAQIDIGPTRVDRALEGDLTDIDGAAVSNLADPSIVGAAVAPGLPDGSGPNPSFGWDIPGVANWMATHQLANWPNGYSPLFPVQGGFPGIPAGPDYPQPTVAGEVTTYITLPKGSIRFGILAWGAFRIESGNLRDSTGRKLVAEIEQASSGYSETYPFEVQEAGTYPFRFSWGESAGSRFLILFSLTADGTRILLNSPNQAEAFKCYRGLLEAPAGGPRVVLNSPQDGYSGNIVPKSVSAVIVDGALKVDQSTVRLSVLGNPVAPDIRKSGSRTSVEWSGVYDFPVATQVPVRLDYQDDSGGIHHAEWSFTTPVFTRDTRFIEAEQMNTVGAVSVPEWLGFTFPPPATPPVAFKSLAARSDLDWHYLSNFGYTPWPSPGFEVTFNSRLLLNDYGDRGFYTQTNGLALLWDRPGNWFQYTRRFPAGNNRYELFVQAGAGIGNVDLDVFRVVSGAFTGNGVTERLGYVSPGERTGSLSRMKVFPVTAAPGERQPVTVTIPGGLQTLRVVLRSGNTAVDWIALRPCQECFTDQTIDFPPIADGSVRALDFRSFSATASSGLPVTVSVSSGPSSAVGGSFRFFDVGLVTLTATQNGNAQYRPAKPVSRTFLVAPASQTIQFPLTAEYTLQPADSQIYLGGYATSGLPLSYAVISGPATINGSVLVTSGRGTFVVEATQPGSKLFLPAAPVRQTIRLLPAPQTIQFSPPAVVDFSPGKQLALKATSNFGLPVALNVSSGPGILNGDLLTLTGSGIVRIVASQPGTETIATAPPVERAITVNRATQSITFPGRGSVEFAAGLFIPLTALSSSGLPVFYSVVSGPGTLLGDSLVLTGAGSIQVVASQPGDANFLAATPVTETFTVLPQSQTLSFSLPETAEFSLVLSLPLNGTASSGLPVSYSVSGDSASIREGRLSISNVGPVTVTASQPGNGSVTPATPASRTIRILPGPQSIDFVLPLQILYFPGQRLSLRATASSELPVTFSVIEGPAVVQDDQLLFTGIGTATVEARQAGDARFLAALPVSRSVVAISAAQVVEFPALDPVEFKTGLVVPLAAKASSGLPVSFQVIEGPGVLTDGNLAVIGAGTIVVVASQPGSDGYLPAAPVTRRIEVARGQQTLTFDPVAEVPYSRGLALPLAGSSSSGLPVSLVVADGPGSIENGKLSLSGVGTVTVAATQPGNADFLPAAPVSRTIRIRRGEQSIRFPSLAALDFQPGMTLLLEAASDSGLPVRLHLDSGPGVLDGPMLTIQHPGEYQITADQDGDELFLPAAPVTRPLQVRRTPQTVTLDPIDPQPYEPGRTLGLRGSSSSGLPVSYTLAGGPARLTGNQLTLLGAGLVSVAVDQPGNDQIAAAPTLLRTVVIEKGFQTIDFPTPPDPMLGGPAISLSASASSGLPVTFRVLSGPAFLEGGSLHLTATGPVQLSASQDGDANFLAAPTVLQQVIGRPGLTLYVSDRNGVKTGTLDLRIDLGMTAVVEETDSLGGWHEIFRAFGIGPEFPVYLPIVLPVESSRGRFWRIRLLP